jgi:hypothetical protein
MYFRKKLKYNLGIEVHRYNPRYSGGRGRRITSSNLTQTKLARHQLKNKMAESMAQVVKCFLSKHEVLDSIFTTLEKKFKV